MKWLVYIIVFVYIFYRTVFGVKVKEIPGSTIDFKDNDNGSVFIQAGEWRAMTCTVPSKDQKMEWYKPNGEVVSRQRTNRVHAHYSGPSIWSSSHTTLELNISRASVDETGDWVCRSGDFEKIVSICVIDPTKFEGTLDEVAVDGDRPYTLSCRAQGNPEPNISWYKDGELINEDDSNAPKYKMMKKYNYKDIEGLLTIASLCTDDAGVYTCEATQQSTLAKFCYNKDFVNITLNVHQAPMFEGLDAEGNIYGKESETLFIKCIANGYPLPKYQWFKKDTASLTEYSDKDIIQGDNGSSILQLKVTEDTYDAQYICRATNKLGEKEKVYTILELKLPERPIQVMPIGFKTDGLLFNITWEENITLYLDDIEVQYMSTKLRKTTVLPKESDWKNVKNVLPALGEIFEKNAVVLLGGLEENTEYWVRMRFKGEFAKSLWTDAVKAKTAENTRIKKGDESISSKNKYEKGGNDDEQEKQTDDLVILLREHFVTSISEKEHGLQKSDGPGNVHGLFFSTGVLAVAIGSTFLTRLL